MPLRITGVVSLALIPLPPLVTVAVDDEGDLLLLVAAWLVPVGDLLVFFGEVVGERLTTDEGFEPLWEDLVMAEADDDFKSLIS